jgi:hypothetical protein
MGLLSSIGSIAGSYFGGPVGGAIGGTIGGALEGGGSSGSNVTGSYDTASAAQLQAARNAQFRPVGITTTFGRSNFQIDPTTGQLVSAGYTLAPELQDLQTRLLSGYGGLLSQAQGVNTDYLNQGAGQLASLGQGYLGESPEAIRNRYISQQNALYAPTDEQTLAGIRNRLYQTGRTGLATGGTTTGLQATNPEMAAYYNSLANRQAQLAANADLAAQNQATFGSGLLSKAAGLTSTGYGLQTAAYDPLKTQLGLGTSIESMGAQPLALGSELGGRASQAGASAGTLASTAAQTGLAGQIAQQGLNATANTSTMNQLTGLFGGGQGGVNTPGYAGQLGSWFNNLIGNPITSMQYGTNLGSQQTNMLAAQDAGFFF